MVIASNALGADSDEDGLTDGQEVHGVVDAAVQSRVGQAPTLQVTTDHAVSYETDPTMADSDDDGYWDGWIGVYGVGRSDNVVLYMHNLHTGEVIDELDDGTPIRGVRGDEAVDEQAGIHEVASDEPGVALETGGPRMHSNVHVGELQWGENPTKRGSQPDPTHTIEVDYWAGVNYGPLDTVEWEDAVERNWALYGIDVTIIRDEEIPRSVPNANVDLSKGLYVEVPPQETYNDDLQAIYDAYGPADGENVDEYLFVGPNTQTFDDSKAIPYQERSITVIYFPDWRDYVTENQIPIERTKFESQLTLMGTLGTMHETGHHLCIGIADDEELSNGQLNCNYSDEVSSGSDVEDATWEFIKGERLRSIMSGNNEEEIIRGPMDGNYFIFSLEELTTVEMP